MNFLNLKDTTWNFEVLRLALFFPLAACLAGHHICSQLSLSNNKPLIRSEISVGLRLNRKQLHRVTEAALGFDRSKCNLDVLDVRVAASLLRERRTWMKDQNTISPVTQKAAVDRSNDLPQRHSRSEPPIALHAQMITGIAESSQLDQRLHVHDVVG